MPIESALSTYKSTRTYKPKTEKVLSQKVLSFETELPTRVSTIKSLLKANGGFVKELWNVSVRFDTDRRSRNATRQSRKDYRCNSRRDYRPWQSNHNREDRMSFQEYLITELRVIQKDYESSGATVSRDEFALQWVEEHAVEFRATHS